MTSAVSLRPDDVVSTDEVRARLGEQGLCVVDARPLPAYNGWRVEGDVECNRTCQPGLLTNFDLKISERFTDVVPWIPFASRGGWQTFTPSAQDCHRRTGHRASSLPGAGRFRLVRVGKGQLARPSIHCEPIAIPLGCLPW